MLRNSNHYVAGEERLGAPPHTAHTARTHTHNLPNLERCCNSSICRRTQRSSRELGICHLSQPRHNIYIYHYWTSYRHNPHWHPFGLPSQQAPAPAPAPTPAAAPAAVVDTAIAGGARSGRTAPSSPSRHLASTTSTSLTRSYPSRANHWYGSADPGVRILANVEIYHL